MANGKNAQINLSVAPQVRFIIKKAAQFSDVTMTELLTENAYKEAMAMLKVSGFLSIVVTKYEEKGKIFEPVEKLFPGKGTSKQESVIDENEVDDPLITRLAKEEEI